MLESMVLIGHVLVAVLIIVVVLLQRGKGAEAGTGFGAGASSTVFGSRGTANFFTRMTAVLAVLFFVTSLTLAYFAQQQGPASAPVDRSVLDESQPGDTSPGLESAEPDEQPPAEPGELPEIPEPQAPGEPPGGGASEDN